MSDITTQSIPDPGMQPSANVIRVDGDGPDYLNDEPMDGLSNMSDAPLNKDDDN